MPSSLSILDRFSALDDPRQHWRVIYPRVVPIDLDVAWHIGRLIDLTREQGRKPDLADLAIAATARCHGRSVLTRNLRHFGPLGVPALDPFAALPGEGPRQASDR